MAKAAKKAAPKKAASKSAGSSAPKKSSAPTKAAAPKKSVAPKKASQPVSAQSSDKDPLLEKFFYDELKDIYYAEKLLVRKLPKMQKAATTDQLKAAFGEHLAVTQQQVTRLEQVFEAIGKRAQAKKCDAMEGLIKEAESIIEDTEKGSMTRDVALIFAGQKVEHYEIATYGGLAQIAAVLGNEEAKNLLGQTLDEEKQADANLTEIAENNINVQAEQEGGEETSGSESSEDEEEEDDEQ